MPSVCLYLKAHQPKRIKKYSIFDIGKDHDYFEDKSDKDLNNEKVLMKVAKKSYIPTNIILLKLIEKHPEFKLGLSLTGVLIDQLREYSPKALDLFKRLAETGKVEILGETYHHSLAFFYSKKEFEKQVDMHKDKIYKTFGLSTQVFANTELAYNDALARWADKKGYKGIITEGWDKVLGWRSSNFVYKPKGTKKIKLLLKNYKLSDDVAFRFSERSWKEWPLTVPKFAQWVNAHNGNGQTINLFMDYETFGEHQWESTGIFNFLENLPGEILKNPDNNFMTPSEVVEAYEAVDEIEIPDILTWADTERDLSAWTGNRMQEEAIKALYKIERAILKKGDKKLLDDWRHMQTSDHFYYMCTKWFADGDVHAYFNPYESPYEAFLAFMNVLKDIKYRLKLTK